MYTRALIAGFGGIPEGQTLRPGAEHLVGSGHGNQGRRPTPEAVLRPWSWGAGRGGLEQTERSAGNLWMEAQIWSPGRPRPSPGSHCIVLCAAV